MRHMFIQEKVKNSGDPENEWEANKEITLLEASVPIGIAYIIEGFPVKSEYLNADGKFQIYVDEKPIWKTPLYKYNNSLSLTSLKPRQKIKITFIPDEKITMGFITIPILRFEGIETLIVTKLIESEINPTPNHVAELVSILKRERSENNVKRGSMPKDDKHKEGTDDKPSGKTINRN